MIRLIGVTAFVLAASPAAFAVDIPVPVAPVAPLAPIAPVAPVAAAAPAAALTPAAAAKGEYQTKVVCKSELETGSLVKKMKTCLTRKQWVYVDAEHQSQARKMVEDNMGRPGGN